MSDVLLEAEDRSEINQSNQNDLAIGASLLCMVCEEAVKQYKCPRCDYFTCSLKCCKQHKAETQCTGKRDRAAYISVKDFKEKNLRSDFHFLEDVLQSKDSAARTLSLSCGGRTKINFHLKKEDSSAPDSLKNVLSTPLQQLQSYPPSVKRLAKAATARNIRLVVMPQGMSKRAANTTQYRPKTDLILWRLHIVFIINNTYTPQMLLRPESQNSQIGTFGEPSTSSSSSSSAITITEEALVTITHPAVDETKLISEILADFLNLRPGNSTIRHALRSLRPDRDASTLRCLIQQLPSRGDKPVFNEAPLDFNLKAVLDGKTVIEYPTIIFGSFENTKKLTMKVEELMSNGTDNNEVSNNNNGDNDVNNIDIDDINNSSDVVRSNSNTTNTNNTKNTDNTDNCESKPIIKRQYLEINNTVKHIITPSSSSKVNGSKRTFNTDDIIEVEDSENTKKVRFNGDNNVEVGVEKISEVCGKEHLEEGQEGRAEKGEGGDGADGIEIENQGEDNDEDEGEEEDEEDEEEDEEEFLRAMKEFEGKDIEALQAYINAQES